MQPVLAIIQQFYKNWTDIGKGSLVEPWQKNCHIVGVDIDWRSKKYADEFLCSKFENISEWNMSYPDLILLNPPFNNAPQKKLYPEVFIRQIVNLFGTKIPIVLFAPMGFRLNQKKRSKRWQWLRDSGLQISSIVSLPLDIFDNVRFHSEILIFNVPNLKSHYWLNNVNTAAQSGDM